MLKEVSFKYRNYLFILTLSDDFSMITIHIIEKKPYVNNISYKISKKLLNNCNFSYIYNKQQIKLSRIYTIDNLLNNIYSLTKYNIPSYQRQHFLKIIKKYARILMFKNRYFDNVCPNDDIKNINKICKRCFLEMKFYRSIYHRQSITMIEIIYTFLKKYNYHSDLLNYPVGYSKLIIYSMFNYISSLPYNILHDPNISLDNILYRLDINKYLEILEKMKTFSKLTTISENIIINIIRDNYDTNIKITGKRYIDYIMICNSSQMYDMDYYFSISDERKTAHDMYSSYKYFCKKVLKTKCYFSADKYKQFLSYLDDGKAIYENYNSEDNAKYLSSNFNTPMQSIKSSISNHYNLHHLLANQKYNEDSTLKAVLLHSNLVPEELKHDLVDTVNELKSIAQLMHNCAAIFANDDNYLHFKRMVNDKIMLCQYDIKRKSVNQCELTNHERNSITQDYGVYIENTMNRKESNISEIGQCLTNKNMEELANQVKQKEDDLIFWKLSKHCGSVSNEFKKEFIKNIDVFDKQPDSKFICVTLCFENNNGKLNMTPLKKHIMMVLHHN